MASLVLEVRRSRLCLRLHMAFSPRVALRLNFPLFTETPAIACPTPVRPQLSSITSSETLLPNKVTYTGWGGGEDFNVSFSGSTIQPTTHCVCGAAGRGVRGGFAPCHLAGDSAWGFRLETLGPLRGGPGLHTRFVGGGPLCVFVKGGSHGPISAETRGETPHQVSILIC